MSAEDVQRFEEKILNPNAAAKSSKTEKIKKDNFKKLVIEVIALFPLFVVVVLLVIKKNEVERT